MLLNNCVYGVQMSKPVQGVTVTAVGRGVAILQVCGLVKFTFYCSNTI